MVSYMVGWDVTWFATVGAQNLRQRKGGQNPIQSSSPRASRPGARCPPPPPDGEPVFTRVNFTADNDHTSFSNIFV